MARRRTKAPRDPRGSSGGEGCTATGSRERLQKILASAGLASRRAAEAWIRAGRVQVNGRVAHLGETADPARDCIRVDGRPLRSQRLSYWLLHKPRGVLSTTRDPWAARRARPTVLELLPAAARRERLFPAGRLDLDSEGLLLLTNDGAVTQALLHPSHETPRVYRVTVRGRVAPTTRAALAAGVELDEGPSRPWRMGRVRYDPRRDLTTLEVSLVEGRKRQIRRACAAVGHPVQRLVRIRMGPLELGTLPPGAVRALRPDERRALVAWARRARPAKSAATRQARSAKSDRTKSGSQTGIQKREKR